MSQAIYLKSILAGIVSLGLSHAAEQREEMTQTTQLTSVERVENNAPSIQKKASMLDIWMCIFDNDFHSQFKACLVNDILPDEIKVSIHQIDPTVTDETILKILKAVVRDAENPTDFGLGDSDLEDSHDIEDVHSEG